MDTTRNAIVGALSLFLGPIGWKKIGALVTEQILNAVVNKKDFDLTVVETCTYKREGEMYLHHHILEFYADGAYAYTDEYKYYSNEGRHPGWS